MGQTRTEFDFLCGHFNIDEGSYLVYFEKVERVALKDAQSILRWTVELVLSGLLGDALWS